MNIIICGAGRVGFTIAKLLSEQGHSITVIDQSSEDIQKINDTLDVKAIVGKATYPSILEKANASEADMIIAVTRNDEINMLICQIAFSIFNIPKKIARIRSQDYLNPKFTRVYNKENLPIDVIISPEIEIASILSAIICQGVEHGNCGHKSWTEKTELTLLPMWQDSIQTEQDIRADTLN